MSGGASIPRHWAGCPDCASPFTRWILTWQTPMLIVVLAVATGVWAVLHHQRFSHGPDAAAAYPSASVD